LFTRAAEVAGLPTGTSIYALRHSSIARMLLRNIPIKLVADLHDTGVVQIERHYGKFITRHADALIQASLLDTSPAPAPANVVSLRG
jgi:hypothetical protein